ncbi:MAG: sigma-70 family RNA polymerase sigma factor [Deltaproteobacteria bacterium]|nr:sigma-70 family RNA polymerase sigma factor [Deltaproteobacteria bacterium]
MNEKEKAGPPDEVLIRAALGGEEGAFRELMERYKGRAFAVAMGITGDADEALDVVQDAFVKAYYNLKEFRFGANFYTWFYRLLVNQAIDRWRKAARSRTVKLDESWLSGEVTLPESVAHPKTPEELAQNRQLSEALTRAVAGLPEYHRAVILLREVEGLAYEEIAEVLHCSVGTVMSRLHYARAKLKEALKEFQEG